jgi:hypothetical protein
MGQDLVILVLPLFFSGGSQSQYHDIVIAVEHSSIGTAGS